MCLCLCLLWAWPGRVQAEPDKIPGRPAVILERTSEALYLSARLPLELTPTLEDVLYKGVPLYFVWQAEVLRSRWYWWDESVGKQTRVVRLAYQPLTRRWRLSVDNAPPGEGSGVNALHHNVDNLAEALVAVARVSNWRLLDANKLSSDKEHRLEFRFFLDAGLLPRPFQIGLQGGRDWNIDFEQTVTVPLSPTGPVSGPVSQDADGVPQAVGG